MARGPLGDGDLPMHAEVGEAPGRDGGLEVACVEVLEVDLVRLVVLRVEPVHVGLEAKVDVLGDEDGGAAALGVADGDGEGEDAGIDVAGVRRGGPGAGRGFLEDDAEDAAVGEHDAFGEGTLAAEGVEAPGNGPRVLAALAGLALELVDLLDDLDGDEDVVVLEVEQGVGVVEEDVGVEDVVLGRVGVGLARAPWGATGKCRGGRGGICRGRITLGHALTMPCIRRGTSVLCWARAPGA